ncbi:MAG TPA: aldehyde dehydrogenase family protein [Terriglobia bacterium]|nr:aldehyde dehydrogenase family protein [Terriglobia bacterium]
MSHAAQATPKVYGFFLNGEWLKQGTPVEIRSPFDQAVVATIFQADPSHVERAIEASSKAFQVTRKMPVYERQRILHAVSEAIHGSREDLARTVALEAGKPIKTARVEIDRAALTFAIAAEESARIYGEWLPLDLQASSAGRWAIVRRFPLGPVAAITPFNFPVNLVAHKLAPAIAAGCPVILKPAPQTPISSLKLAALIHEAGLPAGALNVLPLTNRDAEPLVTDERIKMLTFTGSPQVGWELKKKAGKKRVTLELGGNAGAIIHHDAPLDYAAERCVAGGFSYAGQSCNSVQRILVHESVHIKFLSLFIPRVRSLKTGDPLDESTDVGPLIRESDAQRAVEWIDEAVAAGATLICGGKRRGPMLEPSVLTGTRPEMRVNCQEIFAPAVTVEPYRDFADAVRAVNDSRFGLEAGIFTRDAKLIFDAYDTLDAGTIVAGDVPTFRVDHMPYGGMKDSGHGREGLRYAIEEMTERKLLVMNLQ